jgi:hypothetical protein
VTVGPLSVVRPAVRRLGLDSLLGSVRTAPSVAEAARDVYHTL